MERKYYAEVEVTRVIDGDTFATNKVDIGFGIALTGDIRFRLFGIDTPERKDKKAYFEAKEFTADKIEGKKIIIESVGQDVFGRWLCVAFIEGEDTLNNQLLKNKLAVKYER